MKKLLATFLILSAFNSFSQKFEVDGFPDVYPEIFHWKDTVTNSQIKFWNNGKLRVKYKSLDQGKKRVTNFHSNGKLKIVAEVIQEYSIMEFDSYNEFGDLIESYTDSGYTDVYCGNYIEYYWTDSLERGKVKLEGKFQLVKISNNDKLDKATSIKYSYRPIGIW